ncbi:similar to Saccharomyces cerevisiae YGR077C PEX8 Intraperoxisomal organizer of the peroxisomal import machinery [Maudiozyma saulgeensis]|uniref:Similar to Saccharomyces cerevisiae YGR077C PEX8 Intraperoxisomal organizer of the peroxisomal import machinery n=1 Tax=Maudiozyma saulgeensis TaxID=1789683 RepID=A0A1X7RB50_9SACH|nr:similar to Saccharomyces cerevisiae YGR077C PEX8 Intraperoxisomal organizer of the peroxisomal import machinery [Kazachstania saulgeensis]
MDPNNVNHLVLLLKSPKSQNINALPAVLNNLVYYIPRIQVESSLVNLVQAFFESPLLIYINPLELFEAGQAIFKWKLQISEPTVKLHTFFSIWNDQFHLCQSWTLPKLSVLCGVLKMKDEFHSLQKAYYVDDSGQLTKMFQEWRKDIFIPLWIQLYNQSFAQDPILTEILTSIYAPVSKRIDLRNKNMIPLWNAISSSCMKILIKYVYRENVNDPKVTFYLDNVNHFTRMLQFSLVETDSQCISDILDDLIKVSLDLSQLELNSVMPNKTYDIPLYSRKFISIILTLRWCLESKNSIPVEWYKKSLIILYNLNYIANDFGTVGFVSYEFVQGVCINGILACKNSIGVTLSLIETFESFVDPSLRYPNKINDSRLIFVLEYIDNINKKITDLDIKFVTDIQFPIISNHLVSRFQEVRESAHTAMVSLLLNGSCSPMILQWKTSHIHDYASMVINQFRSEMLTKDQLQIIFKSIGCCLSSLQTLDRNIVMSVLHQLYRAIVNTPIKDSVQRVELIKCLIYQLPYCHSSHICDWLENVLQLIDQSRLEQQVANEVLDCTWNVVSTMHNDVSLRWWYTNMIPDKCRF